MNLTQGEREQLLGLARRGKTSARKVKRSLILCKADEGLTDQQTPPLCSVGRLSSGPGGLPLTPVWHLIIGFKFRFPYGAGIWTGGSNPPGIKRAEERLVQPQPRQATAPLG